MADHDDEELKMALQMSLQPPPEPKRSKSWESSAADSGDESPEVRARRLQRELYAAAAERRMRSTQVVKTPPSPAVSAMRNVRVQENSVVAELDGRSPTSSTLSPSQAPSAWSSSQTQVQRAFVSHDLSEQQAQQLYNMVFGPIVTKDILSQWCNQGFRFSSEPDTSMGLVQREGGPCGVLAAIQALVLKHLLFVPEGGGTALNVLLHNLGSQNVSQTSTMMPDNFSFLAEHQKTRALVLAMAETLWLAGRKHRAVLASLNIQYYQPGDPGNFGHPDEMMAKALEGLSINSASELQKVLQINTVTSLSALTHQLKEMLPMFQSRMGALLFLFSALLSRGLDAVQDDRDDPGQSLVTAPFGHASQEIVNLLLCGHAVCNVFDDRMYLGDGLCLKGIPTNVDVGFLSLVESLNFCKVGQYLKNPRWPIWVVGSESHYTVLFALDTNVQKENELEDREAQIRKVFDAHDQSGGGGFISSDALQQLLRDMNISIPRDKLESLCSADIVVWNEFWQVLMQLDKSMGGLKDSSGLNGRKVFDLYHFNGIAKAVTNNTQNAGEALQQRPRLTKLRVSVPPKWTPEEFMADVSSSQIVGPVGKDESSEPQGPSLSKDEPAQHAPLVDCIRTRWPRAVCNWIGDPPSIV